MKANHSVLALVLASLAAPVLAEKCHICDFSDEPIVVKPTTQSSGGYMDEDVPAGLAAEPTTKEGTIFSKVVGAKKMAEREEEKREKRQAVGLTPLDAPGGLATGAAPSAAEGSGGPPIRSSKPKEIVVVGTRHAPANAVAGSAAHAPTAAGLSRRHLLTSVSHAAPPPSGDVERPFVIGKVPNPVPTGGSVVPRGAGRPTTTFEKAPTR